MALPRGSGRALTLVCLMCCAASNGWAQVYPAKVVRYLIPEAAGSGSDTIGRIIAGGLSTAFGQQVMVDNRAGAGSTIGTDIAAKAPADGYTLLQISSALASAVSLYRNLPFDLVRDFAPVTQLASSPQVVVVHPSLPVRSMSELVKLARARPGAINYGSAGTGSSTFFAAELFKGQVGVNMLHVPYRGGAAALTAIVSGETSVYFAPVAAALPHIRQGRLRPLAVTTARRVALLSDLPTVAESGFAGYETGNWYGLLVPVKTPKEVIAAIRAAAVSVLNNPTASRRLTDAGYILMGDQPDEFEAHIKSEIERLGKIIHRLGLTVD